MLFAFIVFAKLCFASFDLCFMEKQLLHSVLKPQVWEFFSFSTWARVICDTFLIADKHEDTLCLVSLSFFKQTPREQAATTDEPVCPVKPPSVFTSQIHIMCFQLSLSWFASLSSKHVSDCASGVFRPCYSCNIRYTQWIYSMYAVFSWPGFTRVLGCTCSVYQEVFLL